MSKINLTTNSTFGERFFKKTSLFLLLGWIFLIASLFYSSLFCDSHETTAKCTSFSQSLLNIFWGITVPLSIFLITLNHHVWRRACPLAASSRISEYLKINPIHGQPLNKSKAEKFLFKHHLKIQWISLFFGIVLRVTFFNNSPLMLGAYLAITVLFAFLTGLLFGGKSWCQYLCPMGPVQSIIAGEEAVARSYYISPKRKIGPSACVTIDKGKYINTCSSCIKNCIDIDTQNHYWKNLTNKSLRWAALSYPGLVTGFFASIILKGYLYTGDGFQYLENGSFLTPAGYSISALFFFATFSLILVSCIFSYWLMVKIEDFLVQRAHLRQENYKLKYIPNRVRLISSMIAVNLFFILSPISLITGEHIETVIQYVVFALTLLKTSKSWGRSYNHSLRDKSSKLWVAKNKDINLNSELTDGRQIEELDPQEIYLLKKLFLLKLSYPQKTSNAESQIGFKR